MNQHDFVNQCLGKYRHLDLLPEEGWHFCHYPIPKRLGGSEGVYLLPQDHALLGVLQSEEFGCPCLGQWEHHYLFFDEYDKARAWQSIQREEALGEGGRLKGIRNRSHESFVAAGKAAYPKWKDKISRESCSRGGKSGAKTQHAQRWMCTETGYVTTPGPLSRYQTARGIDTDKRRRVG